MVLVFTKEPRVTVEHEDYFYEYINIFWKTFIK